MANESLLAYLTRTVGIWRAAKVGGYIVAWGIYANARPDERHTIEKCGDFWRRSHASMWRDQREFRRAFPGEENPERIWTLAMIEADRKSRDKATAQLLVLERNWGAV